MSLLELTPQLLLLSMVCAAMSGLVVLFTAKKVPARTSLYFNAAFLLVLVFFLGLSLKSISVNQYETRLWVKGWIWSRDEAGAIQLGTLESTFGLVAAMVLSLLAVTAKFVVGTGSRSDYQKNLFFGSLTFSVLGAVTACVSATPFMLALGLVQALFGVFFAGLGNSREDAAFAIRLPRDQMIGVLFSLLGLVALNAASGSIIWSGAELSLSPSPANMLAGVLLATGIFILSGSFPVFGSASQEVTLPLSNRLFQGLLFPGSIAYILWLRESPLWSALGIASSLGYAALVLAFLSALCGCLQSRARESILHWLSSFLLLGLAMVVFLDSAKSYAWFISTLFSGMSFFFLNRAFSEKESGKKLSAPRSPKQYVAKTALFMTALSGAGVLGFVGAYPLLELSSRASETPVLAGVFGLSWLFLSLLFWKIIFVFHKRTLRPEASWLLISAPLVLVVASLGVWWTGCLSGGAIVGDPDRVMNSLLELFFGKSESVLHGVGYGLGYGVLALAAVCAYLGWSRETLLDERLEKASPQLIRVLRAGMGADWFFLHALRIATASAKWAGHWIDGKISNELIPSGLSRALRKIAQIVDELNQVFSRGLDNSVRVLGEVPGKGLQIVQSGNLQWYLVFAIGSGLAMLLHFLRN